MPVTPGASHDLDARLTPRPPGAPEALGEDSLRGFAGGNLIGSAASGLDEARGVEPGEGSLLDRDVRIESDVTRAHGRTPDLAHDAPPGGAGNALASGPRTLGATRGGERAGAGSAPGTRASRAGDKTPPSRSGGLE